MSGTGVLLMYEKQIVRWAESNPQAVPPSPATERLATGALLEALQSARPGINATTITVSSAADSPVVVALGRDAGPLLVNAYTGRIISEGSGARTFFKRVTDLHRWLGQNGEGRAAGRAVTGAANLAFLFLLLSGAYIWLPRMWTWRQVRTLMWFRQSRTAKAREFNWHHVFGLWAVVPLVIVVASGVVMSYPWANALVYRMAGEAPPAPPPRETDGRRQGTGREESRPLSLGGLNRSWASAAAIDGWRTLTVRIPSPGDRRIAITVDRGTGGQPQKRALLTFDRATGALVSSEEFQSLSAGRRLRSIVRFAHTGEILGFIGQTVAGVASFAAVMLVYTGVTLSLRRFAAWRRRRHATQEPRAITAA